MAVKYVDPKTAAWAVERQDALIAAEEVLIKLVGLKDISKRIDAGEKVPKKEQEFYRRNKGPTWMKAFKVVKELDRTHPKRWDKSRV
jgi:hypothetical protein